jgi:hypothetical protein
MGFRVRRKTGSAVWFLSAWEWRGAVLAYANSGVPASAFDKTVMLIVEGIS